MHVAVMQLAPILAEKSRTPFYIAGGLLVIWAVVLSLGLGCANRTSPAAFRDSAR